MGKLDGRVVIVTGAGRGIGAAIAQLCAAQGALVVVNDPGVALDGSGGDAGPAQQVVDRISAAGGSAAPHLADVSKVEQAEDLIGFAIRTFGKADVLVNMAGIVRDRMLFNMEPQEWDAVLKVHLYGTFNTSRVIARHWREKQAGDYRLINTTSIAGLHGAPNQPNYAAAKAGIVGFTYSCANALRRYGATANAISPGAFTRMIEAVPEDKRVGEDVASPEARMTPANVAPAVAYIASPQSGWLNGHVIASSGSGIELYNRPEVLSTISPNGADWELERVWRDMEAKFRPIVEAQEGHQYEQDSKREADAYAKKKGA